MSAKKIRLNRIFHGRRHGILVVAFDHPLVLGPIPGTEDAPGQVRRFVQAGCDGILVSLGMLRHCADSLLAAAMPGIIARLDWTTIWGAPETMAAKQARSRLLARPEEALRLGADAVITYLVLGTGDSEFEAEEIARTAQVARECEAMGVPLIVESLARGPKVQDCRDPQWIKYHTRIAAELGADAIKTDYTGNVASMAEVVKDCPVPILVLGGSRTGSDEDALQMVREIAQAGATGVFFGRNVFQAANMESFLARARSALGNAASASSS
ncbi:MAG: class I fructose-bisphosphate aldolase [Chlamydiota bacterium]